jgi:hypothetical protein
VLSGSMGRVLAFMVQGLKPKFDLIAFRHD